MLIEISSSQPTRSGRYCSAAPGEGDRVDAWPLMPGVLIHGAIISNLATERCGHWRSAVTHRQPDAAVTRGHIVESFENSRNEMVVIEKMKLTLSLLALAVACGPAVLSDPVMARTGSADANDGYEASLASVQAGGYRIVDCDKASGYLRVVSKMDHNGSPLHSIEISTWTGSIRLSAEVHAGLTASPSEVTALHREMQQLARAIEGRARMLAGEATGSARPLGLGFHGSQMLQVYLMPAMN